MATATMSASAINKNELYAVEVKNTFIDVTVQTPNRRATSSVPPSFRFASARTIEELLEEGGSKPPSKLSSDPEASTDSGLSVAGDVSTEVDTVIGDDDSMSEEARPTSSQVNGFAIIPIPLQFAPGKTLPLSMQKLSSGARVFTPHSHTQMGAGDKQDYERQMRAVIGVAEAALARCVHTTRVEKRHGENIWTLVAEILPGNLRYKEAVFTTAKEALLHAAEQSSNVYVLGYLMKPFHMTQQGFIANLGCMPSEQSACWPLFGRGYCCNGASCRLSHPVCKTTVHVTFRLAGSS